MWGWRGAQRKGSEAQAAPTRLALVLACRHAEPRGCAYSRHHAYRGSFDTHGKLVYRLLSSPSENMQKSGDAQVALVLRMLREHPAGLTARELRGSLAVVGGDGAIVRGGPEARSDSLDKGMLGGVRHWP